MSLLKVTCGGRRRVATASRGAQGCRQQCDQGSGLHALNLTQRNQSATDCTEHTDPERVGEDIERSGRSVFDSLTAGLSRRCHMEVRRTNSAAAFYLRASPCPPCLRGKSLRRSAYTGTIAITRRGLPLPLTTFSGAAMIDGAGRGQAIEVAQARQAELAGAVHDAVVRERRIEGPRLAGVGADGLDADAQHVAIVREQPRRARVKAGTVRAVRADVEERGRIGAAAPSGPQQHPRAGGNAAVLRFPLLRCARA